MTVNQSDARSTPWDPAQYLQFEQERAEPFHDLMAGVDPLPGGRAVDLGCGTGALTCLLHEATKAGSTLGLDNSGSMLDRAVAQDGVRFENADIGTWAPDQPFDLVFSNAALQWLPDHIELFERIASWVAPGGQLAIQIPANHHHLSQVLAPEIAAADFGCPKRPASVLRPDEYAILLDRLGFARPAVRLQVYLHHLPGPEALLEWVEGTLLNAYRARMADDVFESFLAQYREAVLAQLPSERPYRFTFPRILIHARKPA